MFADVKYNIIILFGLITSTLSSCRIELPEDLAIRPNLYVIDGKYTIAKLITGSAKVLNILEGQEIEAHCDTHFEPQNAYFLRATKKYYVKCLDNILISYDDPTEWTDCVINQITLECSYKWYLYQSYVKFSWCPSNVTSYILARDDVWRPEPLKFNYLAGICYDIHNSSFYSIYYTLSPNKVENEYPVALQNLHEPGINIEFIKQSFESNSISQNVGDQFENWITNEKYEFSSMIQHEKLNSTYNNRFASLLEFLWWPNLRLYNWQRYINALEEHVANDNKVYDILAGVSGAIKEPIKKTCEKNWTVVEKVLKTNQKIPLYVWNYLQDTANRSHELVIIGLNSPFYEMNSEDDIIFCPDICHEVPWLREVSSAFRYNIMGVVFCCNVQDVRFSKRLRGFPKYDMEVQINIGTTEKAFFHIE